VFNNVVLTEDQISELNNKFGESEAAKRIEALSEYIASKGKKYSSHYATILSWARKDGWKDGNKTDGGKHDNLFLRTFREENERAANRRMGGRPQPLQGRRGGEGGTPGDGGMPADADPAGRNSADADKPNG